MELTEFIPNLFTIWNLIMESPCKLGQSLKVTFFRPTNWVQVVSRQKLICNQENIDIYGVKYDIFSIQIEFLTTNDLDPGLGTKKEGHLFLRRWWLFQPVFLPVQPAGAVLLPLSSSPTSIKRQPSFHRDDIFISGFRGKARDVIFDESQPEAYNPCAVIITFVASAVSLACQISNFVKWHGFDVRRRWLCIHL